MTPDQAHEAVHRALAAIAPEVDLDTLDPAERLRDAADIDSLDFLSLVASLDELTGVAIPEADYPKVETLGGLEGYLVAHAA